MLIQPCNGSVALPRKGSFSAFVNISKTPILPHPEPVAGFAVGALETIFVGFLCELSQVLDYR
jgi:hypothetical protein